MTEKKENPPCPICKGGSIKWGKKITRRGLVQRYQCTEGHLFIEPEGS